MKRTFTTLGVVGLAALGVSAPAAATGGGLVVCHIGIGDGAGVYAPITIPGPGLNGHDLHPEDIIPDNPALRGGQNWNGWGRAIHGAGCVGTPAIPPVVVPPGEPPMVVLPPAGPPAIVIPADPPAVVPPAEPPAIVIPADPPAVVPPAEPAVVPPLAAPPAAVDAPVADPPAAAPPVLVPPAAAAGPGAPGVTAPLASEPQSEAVQLQAPGPGNASATGTLGRNKGYNAQTTAGAGDTPPWLAGLGSLVAAGAAVGLRRRSRWTTPG